jgi:hypothetical protein
MIELIKIKYFNRFCNWIDLPSCLYIVGAVVWSSLIALYRVLFVRAQNWMRDRIGKRKLFKVMLVIGIVLILIFSFLLAIFDSKNTTERMCFHYSIDDVNIIMDYNVSITVCRPKLNKKSFSVILWHPSHSLQNNAG